MSESQFFHPATTRGVCKAQYFEPAQGGQRVGVGFTREDGEAVGVSLDLAEAWKLAAWLQAVLWDYAISGSQSLTSTGIDLGGSATEERGDRK